MKIKVSAIQMVPKEKKEDNLERAEKFINIAVERGANIISFPELFCTKWFPCEVDKSNFSLAETKDGLTIKHMKSLSKKYEVLLVVPFFEQYRKRYYNSCAVIDSGKLLGVYRKVHIPNIPLYEEKFYFSGGNHFPVFDTRYGKIGIQICWDNFFPEGYRILALKGAKLVITPTASAFKTQKRWKVVISSHALLNNIFILRVNRVGKEKFQEFYGNSFLVGPDGSFVGESLGLNEGIFIANCDLAEAERIKKIFTFFDNRRPEVYKEILF
ncbi:MAG: hypothetical protein N2202_00640 [Proteobacteria bacterium]|nr:hypothetical protein [Pseudomonadota bacterium]